MCRATSATCPRIRRRSKRNSSRPIRGASSRSASSRPSAYLLELLLLWTDQSRVVTFGIAGVLGMLLGSAAMALVTRTFRWEGFASVEDTSNHVVGGVLMGFGGVTALGCTIGQGLTGISTLAVGSIITLASIIARLRRRAEVPDVAHRAQGQCAGGSGRNSRRERHRFRLARLGGALTAGSEPATRDRCSIHGNAAVNCSPVPAVLAQ